MDKSFQTALESMICDQSNGRSNIFYYAFAQSKLVCNSALAVELSAFGDRYDVGCAICYELEKYLGDRLNLMMYTDS